MKPFGRWGLRLVLVVAIAVPSFAQQRPMNPTVVVREHAASAVPTECEQGLALAAPRAAQPVAEPVTPPETSSQIANQDVAQALRLVQSYAEAENHEAFVAALAEARVASGAAPPGGQREAAREALSVESDIDRLWSFALESPTGAFFDATSEGGALLTMLRQYPDYGRRIADATLVVSGQTLYPTRESRQFLVQQAASRLLRLGIHSAPRAPRPPAVVRTRPADTEASDAGSPVGSATSAHPSRTSAASAPTRVRSPGTERGAGAVAGSGHAASSASGKHSTRVSKTASVRASKHTRGSKSVTRSTTTSTAAKTRKGRSSQANGNAVAASSSRAVTPATSPTTITAPIPAAATATAKSGSATATSSDSSGTVPRKPADDSRSLTAATPPAAKPNASLTPASRSTASTAAVTTAMTPSPMEPAQAPTAGTATSTTSTGFAGSTMTTATGETAVPGTTATETTGSTSTGEPAADRGGKLNLMFAVILIVAGIGLLVVFLRASD